MPGTTTDFLLAIAALGALAAAIAHSYLGERLFVPQIQAQMNWEGGTKTAAFKNQVVRLAWHAASVMWAGSAAVFAALALDVPTGLALYATAAATFFVLWIMTGPMTNWQHRGWPVFAMIAASLIAVTLSA